MTMINGKVSNLTIEAAGSHHGGPAVTKDNCYINASFERAMSMLRGCPAQQRKSTKQAVALPRKKTEAGCML